MNLWPPYLGAGIHIDEISHDYRLVRVSLRDLIFNRNYVGTHFGGSLFAMTDPFYMLMVMENLGPRYLVWDKTGLVEFIRPGRGLLKTTLSIDSGDLDVIREATKGGLKNEKVFTAEVYDQKQQLVCRVQKTVYTRLKPDFRPLANFS
jgi:hypothetical protein